MWGELGGQAWCSLLDAPPDVPTSQVALLTFIIIYIYSLIAYTFYQSSYVNNNLICETLFECLITTLNFGTMGAETVTNVTNEGAWVAGRVGGEQRAKRLQDRPFGAIR